MAEYVGIDFGNSMVKAAVVETPDGAPKTLRLSDRDPFLPLALRKSGNKYQAGWSAFAQRRRDGIGTVVGMRDLWRSSSLTASLGGTTQPVTAMLGEFLASTGARVQRAATDPRGVVITVPDSWNHQQWALPVAVHNAGWTPEAYVREWVAALAIADSLPGRAVILLSAGFSGLRATLCRDDGGDWKPVRTLSEAGVSGMELRKRIIRTVAETVIHSARRDPREDSENDQLLHDAVEAALYQLHREATVAVSLTVAGRPQSVPLSRDFLASLGEDFRPLLRTLMRNVSAGDPEAATCPLIVWGELAGILPLADWFLQDDSGGRPLHVRSLDETAAGAARVCALILTGGLRAGPTGVAALCPKCGNYAAKKTASACDSCSETLIDLWESLPASVLGGRPTMHGVLTLLDTPERHSVRIEADHFRMGRNPASEWVFPGERFPTVSSAHAAIMRRGSGYLLRDLGSTNGTLVNDSRLDRECELKNGDELRLGMSGPRILFELKGD